MWIMTQGGPANSTETVATYIYVTAFRFFRVGYAQAIAFILFALILILSLAQLRLLRRHTEEHNA
jgi:ABC-type sugar transport system permease subunit